jgi:5-methyltetrahydrofolate--homocysteine methyltransferase
VPVVSNLISKEHRPKFAAQVREEYDHIRAQHGGQSAKLISIEEARANAPKLKFDDLPKPEFVGVRVLSSDVAADVNPRKSLPDESADSHRRLRIELDELVPLIDWSPFFHTWELRGVYPKILQH